MTDSTKNKILGELNDVSIILAVASGLPYTMGDAANVLPPAVKKWVAIIGITSAGLAKTAQYAIKIVSALSSPVPPVVPNPAVLQSGGYTGPTKV